MADAIKVPIRITPYTEAGGFKSANVGVTPWKHLGAIWDPDQRAPVSIEKITMAITPRRIAIGYLKRRMHGTSEAISGSSLKEHE